MALEIAKNSDYGVEANYWKVVSTKIDWQSKRANIVVYGYKDKDSSDRQDAPLSQRSFIFEEVLDLGDVIKTPFPFSPEDNVVAKSYELIKEMPEFKGAINV